jgi:uncharacterized membrane protein YfcA
VILAAVATLIGATLQSATGFGFALILGPALFGTSPPARALTTLLLLGAALNLLVLFGERRPRHIRWADTLVLLAAAAPGLVIGALILRALPKATIQVAVGIAVLLTALFQLASRSSANVPTHPRASGGPGVPAGAVGLAAGILTTTTSTNGPPLILWLQRRATTPAELRDSINAAFLPLNSLGVLTLGLLGRQRLSLDPTTVILLLIVTAVGSYIGRHVFERLDPQRFRAVGLALVFVAGIASIVAGAAG